VIFPARRLAASGLPRRSVRPDAWPHRAFGARAISAALGPARRQCRRASRARRSLPRPTLGIGTEPGL